MSLIGPEEIQAYIQENYTTLKLQLGEIGTCKKVINLELAMPEDLRFKGLALAIMHGNTQMHKDLIYLEHQYLTYLLANEYPVVKLHGEVFAIETSADGKTRYGMLMDYVPNAAFIETKTPFTLEAMILAGLLGIPTKAQEAWFLFNLPQLKQQVNKVIQTSQIFEDLKIKAKMLKQQFQCLIEKLKADNLAISDLQMLITPDGKLTIIDPLDVVNATTAMSSFAPDKQPDPQFFLFLQKTKDWLINAYLFCDHIENAAGPGFFNADLHYARNTFMPKYASSLSKKTQERLVPTVKSKPTDSSEKEVKSKPTRSALSSHI